MNAPSADSRPNRLAGESSPYLLQHAHNPVDWHAWGTEPFRLAREQDKPVFLSVGYSTCYWCHVMERESFENPAVAEEMNRLLISVKVDREERPDVDQLYMTATQLLSRHGGWPMSVFLLPDGRPFFGGTYFPPTDSPGRAGFVTLIRALADAFKTRRDDVRASAEQVVNMLRQLAKPRAAQSPLHVDQTFCNEILRASLADYDPQHGGFGSAPKFPRETLLELLLAHDQIVPDANRMKLLARSLDAMADGGIRDHLGGGFHRYSTDAAWLVPHFEIMLYDNAMLGFIYAEASRHLKNQRYARVARGIFDFVLSDLLSPQGAFYTALDAETDAREGATYLWTKEEITAVLGRDDAKRFTAVYGVDRGPNFADPHHGNGRPDRNVLYLPSGPAEEADPAIDAMRRKLLEQRRKRPQPRLDDKILTSWNALMIRALAHGGVALAEPRYIAAAAKAADFLWLRHRDGTGALLRTSRQGPAKLPGHLDDYAFFAQALLELERAGQPHRHAQAENLADQMVRRFGPVRGGLYFTDAAADDLIIRQKLAHDSPLPTGNAVAAAVFLQLGRPEEAAQIISAFAPMLDEQGEAMSSMVQSAAEYVRDHGPIDIIPQTSEPPVQPPRPATPAQSADEIVNVDIEVFDEQTIELTLTIAPGYHIWPEGVMPPLIATAVQLQSDVLTVKDIAYPWGVEKELSPGQPPQRVYETSSVIVINLRPRNDAGTRAKIVLTYQPCDDRACLPVVTKTLEVNLPRNPETAPGTPATAGQGE